MKKLLSILTLACLLAIPVMQTVGCKSPNAQTTEEKTLASVESGATGLVNAYYAGVIKGQFRTNEVPIVSKSFNQLQADITLAATLVQAGTNAIAPANILVEFNELSSVITTAKSLTK